MAYQGLIFQGYECEFGFWCIYCGFGSGGAEIKASVNPAMDREFVGIGVQSSSVMNMNLDLVLTHISREMRNGSAEIKASVWNPHCGEAQEFVGIVENLWVSWSNLPVL